MAIKDRATLTSDLLVSFPDNTSELITPAILRTQQTDIIDSFSNLINNPVITEVSSLYTALVTDEFILGTGTFTINLPPVATANNTLTIKSVLGGGTVTVDADSAELIEGAATQALTPGTSITIAPSSTADWVIT